MQVGQYPRNHRRIFDAGNDLDETGAFATNTGLLEGPLMAAIKSIVFQATSITAL
jgi:hypothetical protein